MRELVFYKHIDAFCNGEDVTVPVQYSPWAALLERHFARRRRLSPSLLAVEVLDLLVAHGWRPPQLVQVVDQEQTTE
jgi:hypothetical protein